MMIELECEIFSEGISSTRTVLLKYMLEMVRLI